MSLQSSLREAESAVRELRQAANEADGWRDSQRAHFDAQRLRPLTVAGDNLIRALHRTEDQLQKTRARLTKPV